MNPFYSVVIPLYNKAKHIERAINSVLGQTFQDFELIIIDDGSTDNSAELVAHYTDTRIQLIKQSNAGVSAARNKGIHNARGKYISLLDADDKYQPYFLQEMHTLIKGFPQAGIYAGLYQFIKPNGTTDAARINIPQHPAHILIEDYFMVAASGDLPVTSSSACIKKSILTHYGGFPVDENMGEDQSLWSRIALDYPVAFSNTVCASYYLDADNRLCNNVKPFAELPYSQYLQTLLDQGQIKQHLINSVRKYIAGHLLDIVRRNIEIGKTNNAKQLLKDKRSRQLFIRWLYWQAQLLCGQPNK